MVVYLWKHLWKKMESPLRYVKIALCVVVVYLLILSIFARIFQSNKNDIYANKNIKTVSSNDGIRAFITDKKINSTPTGRISIATYKLITCSLIGEACYDDLDKKNPANASTFIASALAYPFLNPPASGVRTTAQALAQAGFIPKSYAAEGVGFASISPLMGVWKAMRDVSYLLLVLVIVTIGFMIMLRTKINPQTIVKVENSLPKIIMALIYITFSFAIAGFLIDLMYIVIVLIIAILGPQYAAVAPNVSSTNNAITNLSISLFLHGPKTTQQLMQTFLQATPWDIIGLLFNFNVGTVFYTLPNALLHIMGGVVSFILKTILTFVSIYFLTPYIGKLLDWIKTMDIKAGISLGISAEMSGVVQAIVSNVATILSVLLAIAIGQVVIPLILGAIIFLTVLLMFFRIFFVLFSNYIKLLVLIVISPLYLLMEAIPGQSTFSSWIKNLLELLVPFPIIIGAFLIGSIIMGISTSGTLWTPPFLTQLNPEYLSAIIGMWILFMIPDFIGIVQKAINPKPLPLDAGLGTFFGGAKGGVEAGLGEMSKYALLAQSFTPLGKVFNLIPGFDKTKLGGKK